MRLLLQGDTIQVFGDGSQLRDFNFVDDCVRAIMLAGASDVSNGKTYNLGGDEVVSLIGLPKKWLRLGQEALSSASHFPMNAPQSMWAVVTVTLDL